MRNKWTKRFLPFIAFLLFFHWPIAYAAGANVIAGDDAVSITIAEPSARPSYTAFGGAIGGVSNPGNLFYVDATGSPSDIRITLYLTNAQQLIRHYRYLILDVGIYRENGKGGWERALTSSGEPMPRTIISMRNGQVSFLLPGSSRYRVAIDGGSFYCGRAADSYSLSPQFHLEAM